MNTLTEVVQTLEQIVADARTKNARHGYFASLYLQMTKAVKEGIANQAFDDGIRMEKLVVIFAGRYVDALRAWKLGMPCTASWQRALDETRHNNISVLQHVLCGINAHINLDLSIAAQETMQGQNIQDLHTDFNRINDVIGNLAGTFQEKINTLSWPMRFVDEIGKNKDEAVANFSITIARDAAWASAKALHGLDTAQKETYIRELDHKTALLAGKIMYPGFWANWLFKFIKWFEPSEPATVMGILNS